MSQPESTFVASTPVTAEQLKTFLNETPLMYKSKLHSRAEKHILTNCYRALWSNNTEWMQTYYFQEGLSDSDNLSHLLEKYNLFGSKKQDTSDIKHENPLLDDTDEPEYWETQRGKQCGHVFKRGESIYRCRNCGLDDTCVMCSKCFHGTKHEGHDIKISISRGTGGCCDCGDPEAWKAPLRCQIHYLDPSSSEEKLPNTSMQPLSSVPKPVLNSIRETISVVVDYILETFAASSEDMTSSGTVQSIEQDCVDSHRAFGLPIDLKSQSYACVLWNDEKHSFDQVISIVKRTIGCTNEQADAVAQSVDQYGRRIIKESKDIQSLLEAANMIGTVGLAVSISSVHKLVREEIAGLLLDWLKELVGGRYKFFSGVDGGNCIIRDAICEIFSMDWSLSPDLAWLSARNKGTRIPKSAAAGSALAEDVVENDTLFGAAEEEETNDNEDDVDDDDGVDDNDILVNMENIRRIARIIEQRRPQQPQETETSTQSQLPSSGSQMQKDILDFDWDWDSWLAHTDQLELNERQITKNLGIHDGPIATHSAENRSNLKEQFRRKLRLDYLLHFDLRLWKSARMNVKDLLIGTFISNFQYRPLLGIRFVRNYPELVDAYYFKDREPENSISTLSVQVLTVPTVASILVKEYKFFDTICTILANFFLTDRIQMILPEGYLQTQVQLNFDSVTRHRYAYTIHDLHYIMNADQVKLEITKNPLYLGQFINMLYQFQAMDPFLHHSDSHVEYESNSWVAAFNITLQISKLCHQFATCYTFLQSQMTIEEASRHLCRAICRILKAINDWSPALPPNVTQNKTLIKGASQQAVRPVDTPCAGTFNIVDYNVTSEPVSFHHSFHWILSELFEHITLLEEDTLKTNGWLGGYKEMVNCAFQNGGKGTFINVLEYPIRTITLLSQINCGVWVRNGYSVRNQAYTYKDINVRENTLDRDIYLLQVGLVVCDSDQLLLTLIDRFQLQEWFKGKPSKKDIVYDSTQKIFMVEELLNLLIICATEYGYASGTTIEQRVRRAIIQNLGLTSLSYSELNKLIPGSLTESETFEVELTKIANFKAPDGLNDKGMYEIKPECVGEIDPYFWHYTRNKREEAIAALKKRWNQLHPEKTVGDKEEFLVEPKPCDIQAGPFQHLGQFLHSKVFVQILLYSLWNTKMFKQAKSEIILDEALYLAMLAVTDPNHTEANFFKNAIQDQYAIQVNEIEKTHANLVTVLLRCMDDDSFSHIHKRLGYIVDKIEALSTQEAKDIIGIWKEARKQSVSTKEQDTTGNNDVSEYERKKAAAKARQAAIMSQFASAQSKFLEQHADEYKSDDEMKDVQEVETEDVAMETGSESDIVRKCHFPADNCIVCQENLDDTKLYGMLGLVQRSNIQRVSPASKDIWADILEAANDPNNPWETKDRQDKEDFTGFPVAAHLSGVDISSCGHLMHAECFETYQKSVNQDSLVQRLSQRSSDSRFLCPLCKAVGNVLVPIVWKGKKETYPGVMAPTIPYEDLDKNLQELALNVHKTLHLDINRIRTTDQDLNLMINDKEKLQFFYNRLMKTIYKAMKDKLDTNIIDLKDSVLQLYDMYAYTIGDREIAQRGSEDTRARDLMVENTGTFIDDVPKTSQTLLKILAMTNTLVPKLMDSPWQTNEPQVREAILEKQLQQVIPQAPSEVPLLMDDPFRALVHLGFSTAQHPSIEPHHLMHTLYIAELAKTVIGIAQSITRNENLFKDPRLSEPLVRICNKQKYTSGANSLHKFIDHVLELTHFNDRQALYNKINPEGFAALIRLFTLPYLRKSLMLMVVHHGFIPQSPIDVPMGGTTNEYDYLLETLRLPDFGLIFELNSSEQNLLTGWCNDLLSGDSKSQQILLGLPTKYRLVNLSYRLDYLLDESSKRICRKCNTVPEDSAICLICGTFVCARRMCCYEENKGECNVHMKSCGGEIGLYMIIKDCYLLFLHDNGGSIMNAPYLDSHGEADFFFKRGSPQFLNDKRYEHLRQMWLSHTIPLFIRRRMESSHTGADWGTF
ncbi:unnamed protein product [Rhizopus stolonifer]